MNIVSASAFLMLVVSPFSMLDVGFQLSFAAVLGIIYVQPCSLPAHPAEKQDCR